MSCIGESSNEENQSKIIERHEINDDDDEGITLLYEQ